MTTPFNDVAAVRQGPRYAIYTCAPTAPDLAHMIPLVQRHRTGCQKYFAANAPPGAQLAGTAYDDEADLGGARPAFERLVGHVEDGRVHVVLLITVHRITDSTEEHDRMVKRLHDAGANAIVMALVDCGLATDLVRAGSTRAGGLS